MQWLFLASACLSVCLCHVVHRRQSPEIPDESDVPYIIQTRSLPSLPNLDINYRYMPTVGNGILSATIYSNEMYVNGLYQGSGSSSHRAMVPTIISPRVHFKDPTLEDQTERIYIFNALTGVFTEILENDFAYVEHRTYTHQKYTHLLVTDIYSMRKEETRDIEMDFTYTTNLNASNDYSFNRPVPHNGAQHVRAWTLEAEEGAETQNFNMIQYRRTYGVTLNDSAPTSNVTMIMSVDVDEEVAKTEFDAGAEIINDPQRGGYALLQEHEDAMTKMFDSGRVEVLGNLELSKVTWLSQYYLLTSLPALEPHIPGQRANYSHTRTSLAKGGLAQDYQGHVFWDSEFYIFPAVLPFFPLQARSILEYRRAKLQEAFDNAAFYGQEGLRYPWESVFSGNDVTSCQTCKDQQIFVSAAISWALRQYYSATGDFEYNSLTCPDTREVARFYDSVISFSDDKNQHEINNIMGPDDLHPDVNNNAFINTLVRLTTEYARYYACECNKNPETEIPDEWLEKVRNLYLPFDEDLNLNHQFEGFDTVSNKTIKQADAILLTYPLDATQSQEVSRNDLGYYAELTTDKTPALTHSFASIGWKQVGDSEKASEAFTRSIADYVIQPFRIWTEYTEESLEDQESSSVNFLSGAGGFLQSLIYGYVGVKFTPGSVEFRQPIPPPGADDIKLKGFKYLGSSLDIVVGGNGLTVVTVNTVGSLPLVLKSYTQGAEEIDLSDGLVIELENITGLSIYTTQPSECLQNWL